MIPARLRGAVALMLFPALLLLPRGSLCSANVSAAAPPDQAQQVDALFSVIAGKDAPGASVMVVRSGKVLLTKSYGRAHV